MVGSERVVRRACARRGRCVGDVPSCGAGMVGNRGTTFGRLGASMSTNNIGRVPSRTLVSRLGVPLRVRGRDKHEVLDSPVIGEPLVGRGT